MEAAESPPNTIPITLQRILVPTDFSEHSLTGLPYAASIASRFAASVVLLHVAENIPRRGRERASPSEATLRQQTERDSLQSLLEAQTRHGIACTPLVRIGAPAEEILRCVEEERIDLVVMATHGRTGVRHMLMGSVAETVVRRSPVPVLTVKPPAMRDSVIRSEDIERELHLT